MGDDSIMVMHENMRMREGSKQVLEIC